MSSSCVPFHFSVDEITIVTTTDDKYLELLPEGTGEEAFLTNAELQHTMLGQEVINERLDPNDERMKSDDGLTLKTAGLNVITFGYRNGKLGCER